MKTARFFLLASFLLSGIFALLAATAPAPAQTTVWSEPTRTKVWSAAPKATPSPQAATKAKPKAPVKIKPAPKGKIDPRLVGVWNLRVPTGVTYQTRNGKSYQRITPGAGFNRLTIQANGAYQWGARKGVLKEARPYFIAEGQRYFEVWKDQKNKYLIRYNERDKSLAMFFDVGGFAAKGTRVTGQTSAPASKLRRR